MFNFKLLLNIGCVFLIANAQEDADAEVENANDYVDSVIRKWVEENSEEIEPYALPGATMGFGYVIFGVNVTGEMSTYDGHLNGLSTVERTGDSQVTKDGDVSRVVTKLRMGVLDWTSKAKVEFMHRGPSVTVEGAMALAVIEVDFTINAQDRSAQLVDLKLVEQRGVEVQISGLGPLSFLVNATAKAFKSVFRNTFRRIVERYMKSTLADVIRKTTQNGP